MAPRIEFVQGSECSEDGFAIFLVEGLEHLQVSSLSKLNGDVKPHYGKYTFDNVPVGTIFTIDERSLQRSTGQNVFDFSICEVVEVDFGGQRAHYGSGQIKGNFRSLAIANTEQKVIRLSSWWKNSSDKSRKFAMWCAIHLERGTEVLPLLTLESVEQELGKVNAGMRESLAVLEQLKAERARCRARLSRFN